MHHEASGRIKASVIALKHQLDREGEDASYLNLNGISLRRKGHNVKGDRPSPGSEDVDRIERRLITFCLL